MFRQVVAVAAQKVLLEPVKALKLILAVAYCWFYLIFQSYRYLRIKLDTIFRKCEK